MTINRIITISRKVWSSVIWILDSWRQDLRVHVDILVKITEIDINIAELKQNGAGLIVQGLIMRRTLFGQYKNLLAELNREDPKWCMNFLRVKHDLRQESYKLFLRSLRSYLRLTINLYL